tara:strand:- start:2363 stop:4021 length:1659 start_codon:yes stop_codon:yes gene_type:complete
MTRPNFFYFVVIFVTLLNLYVVDANNQNSEFVSSSVKIKTVEDGFSAISPNIHIKFNTVGDLVDLKLLGNHYQKDFLPKDSKPMLEGIEDLNIYQGIKFGFLNKKESIFKLVNTNVVEGPEPVIEFKLIDDNPESKSFGLQIIKKYLFRKKTYQIDFSLELINSSEKTADLYSNLDVKTSLGLLFGVVAPTDYWTEVLFGNKGELEGHSLDSSLRELQLNDWEYAAVRNTYFVFAAKQQGFEKAFGRSVALTPPEGSPDPAVSQYSLFFPLVIDQLKPGEGIRRQIKFYLGEKRESTMIETPFATTFDNYEGVFGGITQLMSFVLSKFYQLTGSYGWAILLLTLVVKLMLLPLAIKQTRSMAAMQQLQPEMKRLQEKYANDKQTLNQEMMKLYQTHQVNPIAGCLPMLVQFPIFIALFYTVGGSVEMYGESFYFIPDLAYPDPYAILPILFVISFLISQKKMATSTDQTQKMMMYVFPVVFFFMMRTLSSGVMLYIVGQNIVTNFEQAFVTKRPVVSNDNSTVEVIKADTDKKSGSKKKKKRRKKAVRGQGV